MLHICYELNFVQEHILRHSKKHDNNSRRGWSATSLTKCG